MSASEEQKLKKIASRFVKPELADDLIQESVTRVLEGRRNWPGDVDFLAFLVQVMRSVASDDRRSMERRKDLHVVPSHGEQLDLENYADQQAISEEVVSQASEYEFTLSMFSDDRIGLTFIEAIVEGYNRKDTMELCELDDKGYETVRKRVRRRLERRGRGDRQNG